MKKFIVVSVVFTLVLLAAPLFIFAAKVGDPAPDFTGTASNNRSYHLADYRGKFVVLEWHNNGCPYTRKHYESGNMQKLQKQWTAQGVVWFTIISFRAGQTGIRGCERGEHLHGKDGSCANRSPTRPNGRHRPFL